MEEDEARRRGWLLFGEAKVEWPDKASLPWTHGTGVRDFWLTEETTAAHQINRLWYSPAQSLV